MRAIWIALLAVSALVAVVIWANQRETKLQASEARVVQAEARKQGLRYDSRSGSLQQRDQEISTSVRFRQWLYDYDVEKAAIDHLAKSGNFARA